MMQKRPGHSQACRPLFDVTVAVGVRHGCNVVLVCPAGDPERSKTAARAHCDLRCVAWPLCEALRPVCTARVHRIASDRDLWTGRRFWGSRCTLGLRNSLARSAAARGGPVISKVGPAGQWRWVVRPGRPGCPCRQRRLQAARFLRPAAAPAPCSHSKHILSDISLQADGATH